MSVAGHNSDPSKPVRYKQVKRAGAGQGGEGGGLVGEKRIVVYAVDEVYIYIPPELSAAGFELKISGSVQITDKVQQL